MGFLPYRRWMRSLSYRRRQLFRQARDLQTTCHWWRRSNSVTTEKTRTTPRHQLEVTGMLVHMEIQGLVLQTHITPTWAASEGMEPPVTATIRSPARIATASQRLARCLV